MKNLIDSITNTNNKLQSPQIKKIDEDSFQIDIAALQPKSSNQSSFLSSGQNKINQPKFVKNLFETEFKDETKSSNDSSAELRGLFKGKKLFDDDEDEKKIANDFVHDNNSVVKKNLFQAFNKITMDKNDSMHIENEIGEPHSPPVQKSAIFAKASTPTIKKPSFFDQNEEKMDISRTIDKKVRRASDCLLSSYKNEHNKSGNSFGLKKYDLLSSKKKEASLTNLEPVNYSRFTNDYNIREVNNTFKEFVILNVIH